VFVKRIGLTEWIAYFALNQPAQARPALPAATAVGNQDISRVRGVEYRLVWLAAELLTSGLNRYPVSVQNDVLRKLADCACFLASG